MKFFWTWLKGVDAESVPEGSQTQLVMTHAPTSWRLFLFIAIAGLLVYGIYRLYQRELAACPKEKKLVLALLRIAVVVILLLVWMGPTLAVSLVHTVEPFVLLLIDESLSMSIEDFYSSQEEAAKVEEAIGRQPGSLYESRLARSTLVDEMLRADDEKLLKELRKKGHVRVLTFSDRVKARQTLAAVGEGDEEDEEPGEGEEGALEKGDPVPPLVPAGRGTNLSKGIREAIRSAAGSPIASIVVITDGRNTEGDDPMNAAEVASRRRIPICAVGVGDPRPPRNVRVSEVWAPESAFREDPFVVQATIDAQGMEGTSVEVELCERSLSAEGEAAARETVVDKKSIVLEGEKAHTEIAFEHETKKVGDFIYSIRAVPRQGEYMEEDNVKSATVRVLSEKARVLLVSGPASWEFRLVRNLLIRDPTIDVSCWLQSIDPDLVQDGNTVIKALPSKPEELFEYDVLMLFDPDPFEFNEAWIAAIERYLNEHSGGLLWMAGPLNSATFLNDTKTRDIRKILPVKFPRAGAVEIAVVSESYTREWPLKIKAEGLDHAMMRLHRETDTNTRMWDMMPGIYWSFPAEAAKPASQVLMEHSAPQFRHDKDSRPLLVAGRYGGGRTLYMGFSGTWRWRRMDEAVFDRFWVQAVRFLVEGRLLGSQRRGRIGTDRDVYTLGGRVTVTARLYDEAFEPLEKEEVIARLLCGDGDPKEVRLTPIPNRPGRYEGAVQASKLGINELVILLPGSERDKPVRVSAQFTVEIPRVEFADPRLDVPLLTAMAERSGGAFFDVGRIDELVDTIPDRQETVVVPGKPVELWDTGRLLLLLVILLTFEWAMRKKYRLL